MKFYFAENADRVLKLGDDKIRFNIVGRIAGTAQGVVSIDDNRAEALLKVIGPGAVELTQEEYDGYLSGRAGIRGRPVRPVSPPGAFISKKLPPIKATASGKAATVTEGSGPPEEKKEDLPGTVNEAVSVGVAAPPVDGKPAPARATRRNSPKKAKDASETETAESDLPDPESSETGEDTP